MKHIYVKVLISRERVYNILELDQSRFSMDCIMRCWVAALYLPAADCPTAEGCLIRTGVQTVSSLRCDCGPLWNVYVLLKSMGCYEPWKKGAISW